MRTPVYSLDGHPKLTLSDIKGYKWFAYAYSVYTRGAYTIFV